MPRHVEAGQVPHTPTKRIEIPQLDTIRVVAMMGIFLHHLWKTVIPVPQDTFQKLLDPVFSSASDGVIVFNIISGFLLAMPYLGPGRRPFPGYRSFLERRLLRVIPPYYLALFIFTAANMLEFGFPLLPALDVLLQHLLFVNSLDYSNMYLNLSHFWYIGLLVQFYLLFPLILGFFLRIGPVRAALSIIGLCWGSWVILNRFFPAAPGSYPGMAETLMHFNLPGRLPEFAIGMWLASLWGPSTASLRRSIFGKPFSLFAAAMAIYIITGAAFVPSMNLPLIHVYHVALSLLLFLFLLVWTPAASAGRTAFIKDISEQSYAIYIVHHPLFSYVGVMPSKVTHTLGNFVILTALLLLLSYAAARTLNLLSAVIMKGFSRKETVSDTPTL